MAISQRLAAVGFALLCGLIHLPVAAEALPPDSGIVNVRDFGAKGDGRSDDTQAIRGAIAAAHVDQGRGFWPARIVYFPAGTYLVTNTIDNRDGAGRFRNAMVLVGESADTVRLRLADGAAGYGQADRPKALIFASSKLFDGTPTSGGKNYLEKGEGNDAYGNYVEDMTLDVGLRNPGAVAIDFLANNVGAIRRVAIVAPRGSGHIGISLDRKWPGPLLLSGVRVDGFSIGISISQPEYSVTLHGVSLTGQTEVGIRNDGNSIAMREVSIATAAVALQNLGAQGLIVGDALAITLIGATARWVDNRGYLTIHNTTLNGPGPAIGQSGLAGGQSGAYFGDQRLGAFDADWRISAPPYPAALSAAPSRWVSVMQFGAKPNSGEDASPAIRAVMHSGAQVVYFPSGRYTIHEPIEIAASVRRIVGMHSVVTIGAERAPGFAREHGMLRVLTAGEPLTIEGLALDNTDRGNQVGVEHQGPRAVVIRDLIFPGTSIARGAPGGRLFLENTAGATLHVSGPQGVWARQFNSEGDATRIVNEGAPLSILGLKVEQNCTAVENRRGAQTEVLGGLIYQVRPPVVQKPAFINVDGARLFVSYTEEAYVAGSNYQEHVVQIDAQQQRSALGADRLPARGKLARLMPGMSFAGASKPSAQARAREATPAPTTRTTQGRFAP